MRRNKSLEFSALKIFATVANSDSLTHAAQRLGITQSAVSKALQQLENQTSTNLLYRRSRPIKLTLGGQVLRDYAQKVISDNSRIMNDVKMAEKGRLSHLSLGMIDSYSDNIALQFIKEIKPYADKISLSTGLNSYLFEVLNNREIDIMVTSDLVSQRKDIVCHAILRDPFLVIAPKSSSDSNDVYALADELPFIHYNASSTIGAQTDVVARRLGIELNTHYELDSTQTLMRFVGANYGWAIISAMCLVRYPNLLTGLRIINLNEGSHARYITQLSRKNELGELPEKFAKIARQLFKKDVIPKLENISPWLSEQAFTIDKLPVV